MRVKDNKIGEDCNIIGDFEETKEFEINSSSTGVIIDSLINLYSNPIGSIVREIASNCVDAHRERDLKKLGKRELDPDDDLTYFSDTNVIDIMFEKDEIIFKDHGVGLSKERVKNIFTVFGGSTKRDDNTEIGGFGLGSKSPFAYTNTFFVRTCRNNVVYKYMLSRGTSIPSMDLVFEKESEEKICNFTEVIIPYVNSYDVTKFKQSASEQLKYFPQIRYTNYTEVPTQILLTEKDYILDAKARSVGILIGNVEYPLNFNIINPNFFERLLSRHDGFGLKLKFDIGELTLVPSREAIRYTEETKVKILEKITLAEKSINEKLSEIAKRDPNQSDEQYLVKLYKLFALVNHVNNAYRYGYNDNNIKDCIIYLVRLFGFPKIDINLKIEDIPIVVTGSFLNRIFNFARISHINESMSIDFETLDIKFFAKHSMFTKLYNHELYNSVSDTNKKFTIIVDTKDIDITASFIVSIIIKTLNLENLADALKNAEKGSTSAGVSLSSEKVNVKKLKKDRIYHACTNTNYEFRERTFWYGYVDFNDLLVKRQKNPYIYICKKSDSDLIESIFNKLPLPEGFYIYAVSDSNYEDIKESNPEVLLEKWLADSKDTIEDGLRYLFEIDLLDRVGSYTQQPSYPLIQTNFKGVHLPAYSGLITIFRKSNIWPKFSTKYKKSLDLQNQFTAKREALVEKFVNLMNLQNRKTCASDLNSSKYKLHKYIEGIAQFVGDTTKIDLIKQDILDTYKYFSEYDECLINLIKEDPVLYVLSENYNKYSTRYSPDYTESIFTKAEIKEKTINFINERITFYEKLLNI